MSKMYTTNNGIALSTPDDRQISDTECIENRGISADQAVYCGQSSIPLDVSNSQQCQELPQGSQNSWKASSEQHKGKQCLVCGKKRHYNLIQCPNLKEYIPIGSFKTNKAICTTCLGTVIYDGKSCDHNGHKNYLKTFCELGGCSFLVCKHCPRHKLGHEWFMNHHQPKAGFKNYVQMERDLTPEVVNNLVQ